MSEQTYPEVIRIREAMLNGGYQPIRVRTASKAPIAKGWERGESREHLLSITAEAINTGLLLTGSRAIDIDVDDPQLVRQIFEQAKIHLPPLGKAPIRGRQGSARVALLFRTDEAHTPKLKVEGSYGKVEVLGTNQQFVVHGIHPSRQQFGWYKQQSPWTLPRRELEIISEGQIKLFLRAVQPLIGVMPLPLHLQSQPIVNELALPERAGWFQSLTPNQKEEAIVASLGSLANTARDPYDRWRDILFAVADAAAKGCPNAREHALQWSKRGAGWSDERTFDAVWDSFKQDGGITVGTLLHAAGQAGLDTSRWRNLPAPPVHALPLPSAQRTLPISSLPRVPRKRHWLHGTDLLREAVTLLVAPGGRGKSSWMIVLALACASGRKLLGARIYGDRLRVIYINAEDSTDELNLRFRAAMQHHCISEQDITGLTLAGADNFPLSLLTTTTRGDACLNPQGWDALRQECDRISPDVILVDPLVSLMGGASLNDNSVAALLMKELVGFASARSVAVMVAHHSAKFRDNTSVEAALGAASLSNLARIGLAIDPLTDEQALKMGAAGSDAGSIFRVISTKANHAAPGQNERLYRMCSVEMQNAQPPIYPHGDKVGVVETFTPNLSGLPLPQAELDAAFNTIATAQPRLSSSKQAKHYYAPPLIAKAISACRGSPASELEGRVAMDYLLRTRHVIETTIQVPRKGRGPYARNGLVAVSPVRSPSPPSSQQTPGPAYGLNAGGAAAPAATITGG